MSVLSIRLAPRAAFHLGERGIGYEGTALTLHADTLFAAIATAWTLLEGADTASRALFPPPDAPHPKEWTPPFLLSSAFPYIGPVRLFPLPYLSLPSPRQDKKEPERTLSPKTVEYVSEVVFHALRRGERIEPLHLLAEKVALTAGEWRELAKSLELKTDDLKEADGFLPWATISAPRVTLDVATHASAIWHFGRVVFRQGCGYHFLVRFLNDSVQAPFLAALRLLGDTGIGGDRAVGHGLFTVSPDPPAAWQDPLAPVPASSFLTLSLTYPRDHVEARALLGEQAAYRLVTRSGWIGSVTATPYRRRSVRMCGEGSLLTGNPAAIWGGLADVTPRGLPPEATLPHPIYRWGYAFPLGVSDARTSA